jgi:hypothetical protein
MGAKIVLEPIQLRGRQFSTRELKIIQNLVAKYFDYGRTRISIEVCTKLDWKQPMDG